MATSRKVTDPVEAQQDTDSVSDPMDPANTSVEGRDATQTPAGEAAAAQLQSEFDRVKGERDQLLDRLARLQAFFGKSDCPAKAYSDEFLTTADRYDLDWRLLPSISYVESTGGKSARNNNLFGWDSGRAGGHIAKCTPLCVLVKQGRCTTGHARVSVQTPLENRAANAYFP